MSALDPLARAILDFWFEGDAAARSARYWRKDEAVDATIRERFADFIVRGAAGSFDHWQATAEGSLALLILLDQMSRNAYRGDPRSWSSDAKAREVAERAIVLGHDAAFDDLDHRLFFYLPLEHAEDLATQERCVILMQGMADALGEGASMVGYARAHRDIVARFGRFPHRNEVLGRANTAEEIVFLTQPGSGF